MGKKHKRRLPKTKTQRVATDDRGCSASDGQSDDKCATTTESRDPALAEAYRGVRPIRTRARAPQKMGARLPPAKKGGVRGTAPGHRNVELPRKTSRQGHPTAPITVREEADFVEGLGAGQDRRKIRKEVLRMRTLPHRTLDLHGFTSREATQHLRAFLMNAVHRGDERLLVVFGKGTHSPAGKSVLREVVLACLGETTLGSWLRAVQTAPPDLGGTGAIVVLLHRRPRP